VDPAHLQGPAATLLAAHVYETLLTFDPETLELMPGLASKWEVLDKGKRFILTLREGAAFHNGQDATAADVVFSLHRLADPDVKSNVPFLMSAVAGYAEFNTLGTADSISGIKAIGDSQVEFQLVSEWFDFPYVLTSQATSVISRAQVLEDPTDFVTQPTGSGPYKLLDRLDPEGADLEALDPDEDAGRVSVKFYDTTTDAWRDFRRGMIQIAEAPPGDVTDAVDDYGDRGFTGVSGMLYLGMSLTGTSVTSDFLERASLVLERSTINSIFGGVLLPPTGLTPKHGDETQETCGISCGVAEVHSRPAPPPPPTLTYDYPEGSPHDQLATYVKLTLQAAGLANVSLRSHTPEEFFDVIRGTNHDLFPLTWVTEYPVPDAFIRSLFKSGSPDNFSGFSSPEIDEALLEARATSDPAERRKLYDEIEGRLVLRGGLIPLGQFRATFVANPKVGNFVTDPMGRFRLEGLELREP
jgi:ABC-type transport system substrate-binding protein